jgi:hypothetical protein
VGKDQWASPCHVVTLRRIPSKSAKNGEKERKSVGAGDAGDASTLTPVRSPSPTLAVRVGWGKTNGPARVMRSHFGTAGCLLYFCACSCLPMVF